MARFLAYVDAVPGRLYPLIPTLPELTRRGHRVTVKAGIDDAGRLRSAGLDAQLLAPPRPLRQPRCSSCCKTGGRDRPGDCGSGLLTGSIA